MQRLLRCILFLAAGLSCGDAGRSFVVEQLATYHPDHPLPRYASIPDVLEALDSMDYEGDRLDFMQHPTSLMASRRGDCEDWAAFFVATIVSSDILPPKDVILAEVHWKTSAGWSGHLTTVYQEAGIWRMQLNCAGCVSPKLSSREAFVAEIERREGVRAISASYTEIDRVDAHGTVFPGRTVEVPVTSQ